MHAGVVIRHETSKLKLTKCALKDMSATHDGDLNSCHGICAMGGATSVINTTVDSGQTALHVCKASAVVEDCAFSGSVYSCVKVCLPDRRAVVQYAAQEKTLDVASAEERRPPVT